MTVIYRKKGDCGQPKSFWRAGKEHASNKKWRVEGEIYAQYRGLLKATISFLYIDQSFYVDFVIFWTFSNSIKGLDCVQTGRMFLILLNFGKKFQTLLIFVQIRLNWDRSDVFEVLSLCQAERPRLAVRRWINITDLKSEWMGKRRQKLIDPFRRHL